MVEKYKEIEGMTLGEVAYKYGDGSFEEWIKRYMTEGKFLSWKIYDMIANIVDNNKPAEFHRRADGKGFVVNYVTQENKERLSTIYEQRTKGELARVFWERYGMYILAVVVIIIIVGLALALWRK